MATFGMLFLTCVLAGQPVEGSSAANDTATKPAASSETGTVTHTPAQLRAAVQATLKAAATSEGAARVDAVKQLAVLLDELQHDTQMIKEDRVYLVGLIKTRLQKIDAEAKAAVA